MSITRRSFLGVAGAIAITRPFSAQTQTFTFEPGPNGKILKDAKGQVVLAYLTSKPAGLEGNSACCVHPLNTLAGERVTDLAPPDHKDHRGIFFAWHDMEFKKGAETLKADFWGWGRFAPIERRVIVNKDLRLVRADARSAEIAVRNDWTIEDKPVMQEAVTILAGDEQGMRVLDLTFQFTSDYDVTLNQMAFTGFCMRCRKDGPYTFFDSEGEVTPQRSPNSSATAPATDWPARPWYSHQVTLPDGKVLASAVIDHPKNPPSLWHGARGVSFLNPCVSAQQPVQIPAGKPLALRYRAVARDGAFPAGLLDTMAAAWRKG